MSELYDDVRRRFAYRCACSDDISTCYLISSRCSDLAVFLMQMIPECDQLDIALERLEEVMLWAHAGVAGGSADDGD